MTFFSLPCTRSAASRSLGLSMAYGAVDLEEIVDGFWSKGKN